MTQQNDLLREIDEDLERQKYEDLWRRYGSLIIALAILVVLGTAANGYWETHKTEMHQKATGDLATILAKSDAEPAAQIAALEEFANKNPGITQSTIADLHAAALAARQGNKDQAIKLYDAVAADAKADHAYRQLAELLSVQQQLDDGDAQSLQKRLQPLMAAGEPWRYSAKEFSGYLAYRSGDKEAAKNIFTSLSQDAEVPPSLGNRATDMLRLLD